MYNVRDFGAAGDRSLNDAPSIQAAIDACHAAGGGTVIFPAGDYLSGTIYLRDGVILSLGSGATVWTSEDPGDYAVRHGRTSSHGYLLAADGVRDIGIVGQGTIRGRGDSPLGRYFGVPDFPEFRVGLLLFEDCEHITIRDVTFLQSDTWTVHLNRCKRVVIDGITILNDIRHINSDGIDPNSCHDVHISNCHIVAGDDCIVLKSTQRQSCENIVVTNCTMETTCTAIKLGTESQGDFCDIHFSNCTIRKTSVGIGFYLKDGATMERISFSGISIENYDIDYKRHMVLPIWMDIERRHSDSHVGVIRDVSFADIQIHSSASVAVQGMPERSIENLTMRGITMRVDETKSWDQRIKAVGGYRTTSDERDALYVRKPSYLTFAHVDGLVLDGVRVFVSKVAGDVAERSAIGIYASRNLVLNNISSQREEPGRSLPSVTLDDCQHALVTGCMAQEAGTPFLGVSGPQSGSILLAANHLDAAGSHIVQAEEVPDGAVRGQATH